MLRLAVDLRELRRPGTGIGRWIANALTARRTLAPDVEFVAFGAHHSDAIVSLAGPAGPWWGPSINRTLAEERVGLWLSPYFKIPPGLEIPAFCTVHDTIPATIWYRRLPFVVGLKHSLRVAERVITVSATSRDDLVATWGVSPERILMAPNASSERFSPAPTSGGRTTAGHTSVTCDDDDARVLSACGLSPQRYLLVVSDDRPHKNVQTLVDAFAGRDVGPIVVVGTRRTDLPSPLRRVDVQDDERLAALYRHARALLHPARQEGFGLPPLEAMASGTDVVLSDIPVMREIAGDAARYVAPDDVEGWREAVKALEVEPSRREAVLAAASRFRGTATYEELWTVIRAQLATAGEFGKNERGNRWGR